MEKDIVLSQYDARSLQSVVDQLKAAGCAPELIGSIEQAASELAVGDVFKAINWAWYMTTQH